MSQSTPVVPQRAITLHSVPLHERTVVHEPLHPLAAPAALVGTRDPLTGCLEGAHLANLGARVADDHTPVGVVVVRLEGEGSAGDDVGVPAAILRDALRVQTARFLMRHVRGTEPVLRSAPDEFTVVLPAAGPRDTERVGRRLQLIAFNKAPGALSLGWASREGGEPLDVLIARATDALVPVPQGGRGEERRGFGD